MGSRLDRITTSIAAQVGVSSCAITLWGRPVDASDDLAGALEDWQFVLSDGPALAAARSHEVTTHAGAEAIADACPHLAEHLISAGIRCVSSVPVLAAGECLGTITLFSTSSQPLRDQQRRCATQWADRLARTVHADVDTWASRRHLVTDDFDLATGCVMASSDVDAASAAALIRAHAFADTTPLRAICRQIVHDGLVLQAS